jgi:2-octaprenyl-6-methoxyphenol hydroxylase
LDENSQSKRAIMTQTHTPILIVGGGLAGLTMAAGLMDIGLPATIIDPGSLNPNEIPGDCRTTAHLMPTVRLFQSMGLWDGLMDHATALRSMRLIDDTDSSRVEVMFDAPEIGEDQFGYNLSNHVFKTTCLGRLQHDDIMTIMDQIRAVNLDRSGQRPIVELDSGDTIKADLVIAADGAASPMRSMAGIGVKRRDHHQTAITGDITHTIPHHHISTEFHRPNGPLTLVPLPTSGDHYQSSIVWVHSTDRADEILDMDPADQLAELAKEMNGLFGQIDLNSPLKSYPLATHTANKLTDDRVVLIGEAGHRLHPIGAQGFNLTARDIAVLLDILEKQMNFGLDVGARSVMRDYQDQRMLDIKTRSAGIVGLISLAGANNKWIRRLHRLGLKMIKRIDPFKKQAMKMGMTAPGGMPNRMKVKD